LGSLILNPDFGGGSIMKKKVIYPDSAAVVSVPAPTFLLALPLGGGEKWSGKCAQKLNASFWRYALIVSCAEGGCSCQNGKREGHFGRALMSRREWEEQALEQVGASDGAAIIWFPSDAADLYDPAYHFQEWLGETAPTLGDRFVVGVDLTYHFHEELVGKFLEVFPQGLCIHESLSSAVCSAIEMTNREPVPLGVVPV